MSKARKKRSGKAVAQKFYSNGRVRRLAAPSATLTRTKYRKALPELRRDFEDRCAYCMRYICTEREMEVDHFDPRRKKDKIQVYSNLFLADRHCNGAKGDVWPSASDRARGCEFIDCCKEVDYGNVIFEDPLTHRLVGTTPAAIYHIEMIDLDNPGLVKAREHRSKVLSTLAEAEKSKDPAIKAIVAKLEDEKKYLIPPIPPPPGSWVMT